MGLDGIELRRDHWPTYLEELAEARERLQALGLLSTYAAFSTLFNDTDEGERQLRRDMEIAHALGAPQLRVFQGPAPTEDSGPGWDAARAAIEYAASLGIVIALENYNAAPGGTLPEIRRALDALPSPNLKTNIDIGNYALNGQDVAAAIRALGERAVSTHLKDVAPPHTSTFLGGGALPLGPIFDEFARLPQRLLHCFEFGGGADPDERITQSLTYLRAREGRI